MINKIIHFSVYRRSFVLVCAALLCVLGIAAFQSLPIDAVPDITNNQVQVNTEVPGLAPEEIERTVTYPMELALRGMPGAIQMRSTTRFGLSQVTIVFDDGLDIYRARQLVTERITRFSSELPKGAKTTLGPISTGLGEIYQYILDFESPAIDDDERFKQLVSLRTIQDYVVKPAFLTVVGVAEVNTSGGYEKQFHVKPEPKKMRIHGIHFGDIVNALQNANINVGGGYVQQTSEQFLVQGIGLFENIEDIENLPIRTLENFRTVKIGDIASVKLGKELRTGAATYNGRESVSGTVMMLLGSNSRTVAKAVDTRAQEINSSLPKGVALKTVYDRSVLVDATIGTVEHNLLLGACLVVLVLLLLIGNLRAAVITAITIPISLLITFLIMRPLGVSGNLLSLGALDFGIIVDGTIIVLDNCVRMIHERTKKLGRVLTSIERQETVYEAAVEIRTAAGFGELIIVIVFLPIFGLVGIEGKMFHPMAITFCIAILAALALSFTLAPALASLFLSGSVEDKEPRAMEWVRRAYSVIQERTLHHRKLIAGIALGSILLGVFLFSRLGGEFLPQMSEGSYTFHMIRPVNASLDQSIAVQIEAEKVIQTFPEVKEVYSRIGTSEVATDPMGVNLSDTFVMLKEKPKQGFIEKMIAELEQRVPGQRYLLSQPIQMRFNELLEGTRADVTVKIFGPDLGKLMELGKEIKEVIENVSGAGDVEMDLSSMSPVMRAEPKKEFLASLGMSAQEVLETIRIALGGEEAGYLYEKDRRFPIIVRLDDSVRSDITALQELPVGLTVNATMSLKEVANINFRETYASISREDGRRRSAVLINLRGRDTESFVREAQAKVKEMVNVPDEYSIHWGGNFKNLEEAKSRLLVLTPIALLLVLLMIYAAFQSLWQTALVFLCAPLALVGGVLGLQIFDLPFSISAGVGFIALSGIAVMNGVVLVNFLNQLKAKGMEPEARVKEGTLARLRPVLMTALVDIFGFIPMVLSTGLGAEVQRPLAAVVIGGVLSSTLLTLLVLPTLYLWYEEKKDSSSYKKQVSHG
jgi:heavy metal efflux system protein